MIGLFGVLAAILASGWGTTTCLSSLAGVSAAVVDDDGFPGLEQVLTGGVGRVTRLHARSGCSAMLPFWEAWIALVLITSFPVL